MVWVLSAIWIFSIIINILFTRGLNDQHYREVFQEENFGGKLSMIVSDFIVAPFKPIEDMGIIKWVNYLYVIPMRDTYWGYVRRGIRPK